MRHGIEADLAEEHYANLTALRAAVRRYLDARDAYIVAPDAEGRRTAMDTCVSCVFDLDARTRPVPHAPSVAPFTVEAE